MLGEKEEDENKYDDDDNNNNKESTMEKGSGIQESWPNFGKSIDSLAR